MTKLEVDEYFTNNWSEIVTIVKGNSTKCATVNPLDITSDIYELCVLKAEGIRNIKSYISIVASNIYRWQNSEFNIKNYIKESNSFDFSTLIEDDSNDEELHQQRNYALELYKLNATHLEKRFLEIYIDEDKRSIRKVQEYLGISFRGANILITDLKTKLKEYEWKE